LGGMGQATSSSNVGASIATGATSRAIGFAAGGLFILAAFFPKLAALFAIMPKPVMGSLLIFVTCFMILAGIQIMTSRLIDIRKTFVLGISLIFGLSVDILPELYKSIPFWLHPVFSSSLSLATISALLLHLMFRIGVAQRVTVEFSPSVDSSEKIFTFVETQGATWGVRREVVYRATAALNEVLESVAALKLAKRTVKTDVSFDEFNLDVNMYYEGTPLELSPSHLTETDLLSDETALAKLSGLLIRQYADRVKSELKDGLCHVQLHFDH
jgi:NCS2 family nucleobase:cation symporter-2